MSSFVVSPLLPVIPFVLLASSFGQAPSPAPGLTVPGSAIPYALDHFGGSPELVPVHHSSIEVNNHKGANLAGSLAGSVFYKPKMTTEVAGVHARTVLHDAKPVFYLHLEQDPDGQGDGAKSNIATFALVQAKVEKDKRVFAQIKFTQLTGNAKRNDSAIETTVTQLSDGWLTITPASPLAAGEYALSPLPKVQNTFSTVVYDFSIDPSAGNATDAIVAKP